MSLSRIRVVSTNPLPNLKIWLPIPTITTTVGELIKIVSKMLGGIKIELELDGL